MSIPGIPMAAIMIATTVASTAASVGMQMAAQSRQKAQRAQELENARASAVANYDQINLRHRQEREAAGQKLEQNRLGAMQAQARARVAADEAGVAGNSVDQVLRDLYGQEARYNASVRTNLENTSAMLEQQAVGVQNQTQGAMNNAQQVTPVDWGGAAAGLFDGVSNAYMADLQIGKAGGKTLF